MNIPLFGEVTPLRAFFLFLFFYSNDSNNLSTWSSFGAGMLLQNLLEVAKQKTVDYKQLAMSGAITFAVLGYASIYLEQIRMMSFLALQSFFVPMFKHKVCLVEEETAPGVRVGKFDFKLLSPALLVLIVSLYLWDGLSGLTSGTLFLIVMPEFFARLPTLPSAKTLLAVLLVFAVSSPLIGLVIGAVHYEKEIMELPAEYRDYAKMVVGARPESVPDYYKVIGVRRGAETAEIKKVFRELSKKYHPDKTDGNEELQAQFVKITEAVRKLTGKGSDREAHAKELENAELQDMITRAIYYCALFALWFVMYIVGQLSQRNRKEVQLRPDGTPVPPEEQETPETRPPKPSKPLTRGQWFYLLLSGPVIMGWLWIESTWAELPTED